ncbi:hypothetical protein [Serratia proteamaculans]
MSLSKKAVKENDVRWREKLKRRDNLAAIFFFVIPAGLFLAGGRDLARLTPLVWLFYCIAYLVVFRRSLQVFSTDELRFIARHGNNHPFYALCWILVSSVVLMLLAFMVRLLKT